MIKIESIRLHEVSMPLVTPFQTSFGTTTQRRILLVEMQSEGLTGWGEVTTPENPFYNPESIDQAWVVLRDFLIPMLLGASLRAASDVPALLARVRGSEMSKAALENAIWDIEAQQKQKPLHQILGGVRQEVACGVSLGLRKDTAELLDVVEREVSNGYQRIKLKISPGQDVELVEAVRRKFPEILLSVDANSAYDISQIDMLRALDDFSLLMIEQPLQWDEIYLHARLQSLLKTAICLDECIHNIRHASAAVELHACRIINIKLGRVGGHTEAREIQKYAQEHGVPAWCGGMLESGIGRAHNIAMSTLLGITLPGDVSARKRYWKEDIVEPAIDITQRGTIIAPDTVGLGYTVCRDRIAKLTVSRQEFNAAAQAAV